MALSVAEPEQTACTHMQEHACLAGQGLQHGSGAGGGARPGWRERAISGTELQAVTLGGGFHGMACVPQATTLCDVEMQIALHHSCALRGAEHLVCRF